MAQIKSKGPNLVERAIASVSPRWALKRYAARMSIEAVRKYEAAESSRLRPDNRSKGSADNVNRRAVEVLRERARYMDENFDIASGALDVLESKIVGSGIRTHPMVRSSNGSELARELNDRLADLWEEWTHRPEVARELNWAKCQRLLCRSWLRDGEGFGMLMDGMIDGLSHATPVPFSIDLLEGDYVPVTAIERIDDELELVHGIIRNRWGQPQRYLVYQSHPGSTRLHMLSSLGGGIPSSLIRSDTKEVRAEDVLHLKHTKRIRQSRGISVMATVFNRLEDLKDYEESERVAARIGAYVALQRPAPGARGERGALPPGHRGVRLHGLPADLAPVRPSGCDLRADPGALAARCESGDALQRGIPRPGRGLH